MFLSKVFINWRWARNPYQLHRAIWQLFPDRPEADRNFLFRVEEIKAGHGSMLLLQSRDAPQDADVAQVLASKIMNLCVPEDVLLRFRLRANPIKTIKDEHERLNTRGTIKSCRVPLIHEEEQLTWLQRKLADAALLQTAQVIQEQPLYFHKDDHGGKIQPVCFDGVLTVADTERFTALLTQGIGPAKGMGCGLLSIGKA